MNFGFLGGLNEAFRSYDQGVQTNIDRAGVAEDRAFQRTQRDLQQRQQQRMVEQQGRDDTLRNDLAKVKPAGTAADVVPVASGGADAVTDPSSINAQNGSDIGAPNVAAAPRVRAQDEELRDIASAYRKQGDVATSLSLSAQADQIGMARAARMTQDILAGAKGKTAVQLATDAQAVYNNDPLGGTITGIQDLGGGAARVIFKNRDTGQSMTKDFANADEVAQGLQAHYDPTTYAATIKARYEHKLKQEDATAKIRDEVAGKVAVEKSKTVIVPSGATALIDGKSVLHNPREFRPVTPAAVKPGDTLQDKAVAAVSLAVKNGAPFATAEQASEAQTQAEKLITENPAIPPQMAGRLAVKIASKPEIVKPRVNVLTGMIDSMVLDELSGDAYSVRSGIGAARSLPAGVTPELAKGMTNDLLAGLDKISPGLGSLYAKAAHDPTGKARVAVEAAERKRIISKLSLDPRFAQATPQQREAVTNQVFEVERPIMQNRLDMILNHGEKPAVAQSGEGFFSRLRVPQGLSDAARYVSDLGDDYESPAGKAKLKQRVAESKRGGAPMTDVETLRAQQASLL